jgi:hypothetical protein
MKDPKIHSGIGIHIMIPGVTWMFQKNNDILIRYQWNSLRYKIGLHAVTIVVQFLAAIKRVRNKLGIVDCQ